LQKDSQCTCKTFDTEQVVSILQLVSYQQPQQDTYRLAGISILIWTAGSGRPFALALSISLLFYSMSLIRARETSSLHHHRTRYQSRNIGPRAPRPLMDISNYLGDRYEVLTVFTAETTVKLGFVDTDGRLLISSLLWPTRVLVHTITTQVYG
jgi:hypothetical protein